MYAVGLALFTLASLACGLAPSAGALVASRVVQGSPPPSSTPQVLAIIATAFTGQALVRAFTAYGLTLGIAAVFGQLIGGSLIAADLLGSGWRACFLINLPIGATALLLVPRVVPRSDGTHTARLDPAGVLLATLALFATVLPLIQGPALGWPAWTYASFAVAVALFAGFVAHQRWLARRDGAPLIDLSMFASRGFAIGMGTQFTFWIGQASFFLTLALFLQEGRGLSPLRSGVVFTAIGAGYLLTSASAGWIAERIGRQTVAVGALLMTAGLLGMWLAVRLTGSAGSIAWLVPGLFVDGVGMGIALSPLASTVLSFVPARHAGAGSGVLSTGMQVGGAVGVALIGLVFYHALAGGYPHAFGSALLFLVAVELAVAALVQVLPRPARHDPA